jgi:hypothetical protein
VFVVDLLYRVRQRFSDAAKREEEPLTEQGYEREELDVNLHPHRRSRAFSQQLDDAGGGAHSAV